MTRNCYGFFLWLTESTRIWSIFVVLICAIIAIFGEETTESFRDALETFNVGFAAIFGVLISLLFSNGVEKNKENKRLFQALCGDIKALAFFISALTDDDDKYDVVYTDETKRYLKSLKTKKSVEVELAKVRYLLCVLAPVAKHVLRQAPRHHTDAPNYEKLDDKYRVKLIIPLKTRCCRISFCDWCCCKDRNGRGKVICNGIRSSWLGIPLCCAKLNQVFPFEEDHSQAWSQKGGKSNPIKRYLYKKIKYISDTTDMDLFEVLMYCILDQLNTLREYKLGIDDVKGYSKERDLILKWQHIYGSWGTMYSLTTYKQPIAVHMILTLSLLLYTISLSLYYKAHALNNWDKASINSAWYGEDPSILWIQFYAFMQSVLTILPFTVLWSLGKTIGRPFKRGAIDSNIVTKDAKDTQAQVSKLMRYRACIDKKELWTQFDVSLDAEYEAAKDRESILMFAVEKKKGRKARRRSYPDAEDNDAPPGATKKNVPPPSKPKNVLKFKNVNF